MQISSYEVGKKYPRAILHQDEIKFVGSISKIHCAIKNRRLKSRLSFAKLRHRVQDL